MNRLSPTERQAILDRTSPVFQPIDIPAPILPAKIIKEEENECTVIRTSGLPDAIAKLSQYDDDIIIAATDVYSNLVTGSHRQKPKDKIICFCVYQAHLILGKAVDPYELGRSLGLDKSDTHNAITSCSRKSKTGYGSHYGYQNPHILIANYARRDPLRLSDTSIEQIITIYDLIISKSQELCHTPIRKLISGLICFYLTIEGYSVDFNQYSKIFELSTNTIKTTLAKISSAYNS